MTRSLRAHLTKEIENPGSSGEPRLAGVFSDHDAFLGEVFRVAPFLGRLAGHEGRLERVLSASPDDGLEALFPKSTSEFSGDDAKTELRRARQDLALGIALCDFSRIWPLSMVTRRLSDFADRSMSLALDGAWADIRSRYGLPADEGCGLTLIGMGKLGAQELNYSSDIDFVALYDPSLIPIPESGRIDAKGVAIKVVQRVVDILSEQMSDGLVFRTDLRLRPNPGATPVAVSLHAAETYYQDYGQNWERAAFIKARHCAGDAAVAEVFFEMIRPFIWRRALDYGAVADIHAIKKQIHAEKGNLDLEVAGGNIKLGPGGIREIEFFVQTQQLLLGGRDERLRNPTTLGGLLALVEAGHVTHEDAERLAQAYVFFRHIEHRLQMREDAQTHEVPARGPEFDDLVVGMGYTNPEAFAATTREFLIFVHEAYADLFATPEPREPVRGSLVFTGVDDDPRTLATLTGLGFEQPSLVTDRIRRWHQGGLRATRSARARELLTALIPRMLTEIGEFDDPDAAFRALDMFLAELPDGFQVFALLTAEPKILADILALCDASPDLVRRLGRQPSLVEGLLEGLDFDPVPITELGEGAILEDHLDEVRRVVNEHRARATAGIVLGQTDIAKVGPALAEMAERAIGHLCNAVVAEQPLDFRVTNGGLGVVAFGRLGARHLTPASDLDLVFVYQPDHENGADEAYFTRLIRRIVSALSVPTAEGDLYQIDMQLRPSGGAGPTAVSMSSFEKYYAETAWVWEMMALSKARVVYGSPSVTTAIEGVIDSTFRRPRDEQVVSDAVVEMRRRLVAEKPARSPLDLKRRRGGLTDIEFLLQYLALREGQHLGPPPTSVPDALARFEKEGVLSATLVQTLGASYRDAEILTQFLRALVGPVPPPSLSSGQAQLVKRAWGEDSLDAAIEDRLTRNCEAVIRIWNEILAPLGA